MSSSYVSPGQPASPQSNEIQGPPSPYLGSQDINNNNITVSAQSFDLVDNDSLYTGQGDNGVAIYEDYLVKGRYEKDGHIYMGGITSPGGFQGNSVAFYQLSAPTLLWLVSWTAMRWDELPFIPDPTPSDPNWILMDDHWELLNLIVGADGTTPRYRISGLYVYGNLNPATNTYQQVNFSVPPWLDGGSLTKFISVGNLSSTILSTSSSSNVVPPSPGSAGKIS